MLLDQLRFELRILGKWVFLTPIIFIVCLVILTEIMIFMHASPLRISQVLTGSLEMLLPIAAGIIVTNFVSYDVTMELQLSMARKFRCTALIRLALIVVWMAAISCIASAIIYHLKFLRIPTQVSTWSVISQVLIEQFTWLAPLLWFVAVGLCLALLIRSRAASSALLAGIWIVEAIFFGYFVFINWLNPLFLFPATLAPTISFWLLNRYEILGTGLLMLPLCWLLLYNSEALLQGTISEA